MNGFHRGLEEDPSENKDSYCESDLPCPRRLWTPPNQGQRQRPHTADCDDNKGFPKIPLNFLLCKARVVGGIQKLAAVLALYRFILNFFSAERTLFHCHLFGQNEELSCARRAWILVSDVVERRLQRFVRQLPSLIQGQQPAYLSHASYKSRGTSSNYQITSFHRVNI